MNNLKELERKVDLLVSYIICPEHDSERKESLLLNLKDLKSEVSSKSPVRSLRCIVEDFLTDFGVPSNILGYKYLTTAVCIVVGNPDFGRSVCKELYPEIAKLHFSTASRVERAIRHAIEVSVDRGNEEVIYRIFDNTVSGHKGKPTNTEFIFRVAQIIKREVDGNEV